MPGDNFGKALYHRCADDSQVRQLAPLYYRDHKRRFKATGAFHCGHCGLGYWKATRFEVSRLHRTQVPRLGPGRPVLLSPRVMGRAEGGCSVDHIPLTTKTVASRSIVRAKDPNGSDLTEP